MVLCRSLALVEGLRPDTSEVFPGVRVTYLPGARIDRELPALLDVLLEQEGFSTRICAGGVRPAWLANSASARQCSVVITEPFHAPDPVAGAQHARALEFHLLGLLTLLNGGRPKIVGGAFEFHDGDLWRTLGISTGPGARTGSALAHLGLDNELDLQVLTSDGAWAAHLQDQRSALWLSLFAGASTEPSDGARVMRLWSLLEAISDAPPRQAGPLLDAFGTRLLDRKGRSARPGDARARVYLLVVACLVGNGLTVDLVCHPGQPFWEEVGIWLDLRNVINHYGAWTDPTPSALGDERTRRVHAALRSSTGGGDTEEGLQRYALRMAGALECVVHAVLRRVGPFA